MPTRRGLLWNLNEIIHESTHKRPLPVLNNCGISELLSQCHISRYSQLLRHSACLYSVQLIMCTLQAYIHNPEIRRETEVVSPRGASEWLAQVWGQVWGPQGLRMWVPASRLGTLNQETRASRCWAWQLKAADFIPAVVALPTQVEWTNCYFPPPSCAQRQEFTHHGTRVPSLLPYHSAELEVPADLTQRAMLSRWEPGLWPWKAHSTEQRSGQTRVELLIQIRLSCALRNKAKVWILKPAAA